MYDLDRGEPRNTVKTIISLVIFVVLLVILLLTRKPTADISPEGTVSSSFTAE